MNRSTPLRLFVLPGLDGTGILFRPLQSALPDNVQAKVVSYPTDTCLSLAEHAAIVADTLPDNDIVLLAESFSGLVALELLRTHRPCIRKILFVASFATPPHPLLPAATPLARWAGASMQRMPELLLRRFCIGRDADDTVLQLVREAVTAVQPHVLGHRLGIVARTRSAAPASPPPCAHLRAGQDRLVTRSATRWLHDHLPDCTIDAIDGPHFLLQTKPRECAEWISDHLN